MSRGGESTDGVGFTCADHYHSNKELYPLSISCLDSNQEFKFTGCFKNVSTEGDINQDHLNDFPTRDNLAERIISANNHLYFNANNTDSIVPETDGIKTWTSERSKIGSYTKLSRLRTTGRKVIEFANNKFAEFDGEKDRLFNDDYRLPAETESYTKVMVYSTEKPTTKKYISSGKDGYHYEYIHDNDVYSNDGGSTNMRVVRTNNDVANVFGKVAVQINNFDGKATEDINKFKIRVNGKTFTPNNPTSKTNLGREQIGLILGGVNSQNYSLMGSISQYIVFDKKLTAKQEKLVENYFLKKYGVLDNLRNARYTCGMPYCNTERESLTREECLEEAGEAFRCASGYDHHQFHPIDIQCNPETGKFVLSGCYPIDDDLSLVEEQVYDPTTAQKVERLIVGANLYHFDSESGVVENSDDIITNWTSNPSKYGTKIELTQQRSSGTIVVDRAGEKICWVQ